ncbi:MAG: hypothetical protein ACI815_002359 [Psychroserpens sp.]|jgi:hypothetical protein
MIQTRLGNSSNISGVLKLQEQNLYKNLSEEELKNGFVTTPFSRQQIEEILDQKGLFVCLNEQQTVIAYVFAGSWDYFAQWEIFNIMTSRFPELSFDKVAITTTNSFQYGPICIHKNYRGQGIINSIFEAMRLVFVDKYPISITFINKINLISTRAHTQKLGWQVIDEFEFNNNTYIALAFDMTKSVLKKD